MTHPVMPHYDASAANKSVVLRFIDALNKEGKTADVLGRFTSSAALVSKATSYESRYPGFRLEPVDLVAERDLVAVRFFTDLQAPSVTQRATVDRETGEVRPEKVEALAICRLADERITEFWLEADVFGQALAMRDAHPPEAHAAAARVDRDVAEGTNEKREANRSLILRYLATLNNHEKTRGLIQRFASDTALAEHVLAFEAGFPGYSLLADEIIAEGDKVVVRFHTQQRHSREFMGIPATDMEFSITGIVCYRIENGLIVEHWLQADTWSLVQELQEASARSASAEAV